MKYIKVIGSELLRVFGFLWLLVETISYFVSADASTKIKDLWWVFLIGGIVISIIQLIPIIPTL